MSEVLQFRASFALEPSQLWAVLDILPVAVLISTDRSCTQISGNAASRALFRATPGQNLSQTAPPDQRVAFQIFADGRPVPASELPMEKAASTGQPVADYECELRFADGTRTVMAGHCVPVFDRDGEVCGAVGAFVDITVRKQLEEENRLLTDELSHRVKNTVSIIQAISRQTIRPLLPPEDFRAYEQRLIAISKAHDLLFAKMSSRVSVAEIIEAALSPITGAASRRIELKGPALNLLPHTAVTLIMILHELGTNAYKYGSLSQAKGLLEIGWRLRRNPEQDLVAISWKESGGPLVEAPRRSGFGSKMIEIAVKGLHGGEVSVDYRPAGLRCEISVPCHAVPPETVVEPHAA